MGYYIDVPPLIGKVKYLCEMYDAREIEPVEPSALPPDQALVCVVLNIGDVDFDAAAYVFDDAEFEEFRRPEPRPKRWLLMNKRLVEELSRYPDGG
jgi:hypothetical protein